MFFCFYCFQYFEYVNPLPWNFIVSDEKSALIISLVSCHLSLVPLKIFIHFGCNSLIMCLDVDLIVAIFGFVELLRHVQLYFETILGSFTSISLNTYLVPFSFSSPSDTPRYVYVDTLRLLIFLLSFYFLFLSLDNFYWSVSKITGSSVISNLLSPPVKSSFSHCILFCYRICIWFFIIYVSLLKVSIYWFTVVMLLL